jgi:hypothetical protein
MQKGLSLRGQSRAADQNSDYPASDCGIRIWKEARPVTYSKDSDVLFHEPEADPETDSHDSVSDPEEDGSGYEDEPSENLEDEIEIINGEDDEPDDEDIPLVDATENRR